MFTRAFAKVHAAIDGNAGMIFALCSIPLFVYAAFSIDSARQVIADRHVQAALDSASLAGVRSMQDPTRTDLQIQTIVSDTFNANLETAHSDLNCAIETALIERDVGTVRANVECEIPAMIGRPLTPDVLKVNNSSLAQMGFSKLDLAMMVDVSDSMFGERLTTLKQAAKDAARELMSSSGDVRISLVPYGTAVNAGVYGNRALGRPDYSDPENDGVDRVRVTERVGIAARTDDAPGPGKWVTRHTLDCPISQVLPLTNDYDEFERAVDGLQTAGITAGQLGAAWSWYSISPKWKDVWPAGSKPNVYGDKSVKKAVILMTDGNFNYTHEWGLGESNPQVRRLCDEMHKVGVIIFGVAFHSSYAVDTLEHCAGHSDRFFHAASDEDLLAAYAAIAAHLSEITLRE